MLLLVEGDRATFAQVAALLGDVTLERTSSIGEARRQLVRSEPAVLLIARDLDQGAAALLADVRTGRFVPPDLPVVAVVDGDDALAAGLGVDVTVPLPLQEAGLRDAVERARALGCYREAIGELFEICRRGADEADERLAAVRREADRRLSEIQADGETVPLEALLGTS